MSRKRVKVPTTEKILPGMAGDPARLVESCGSLLLDFPEAVLIADGHKKVVFLNRAAEKIFGASLRLGDPCPICAQLPGLPQSVDGTVRQAFCRKPVESLKHAPILPKAGWSSKTMLTVTANSIKGQGDEPEGCLVVVREHEELVGHQVVQQQIAALTSILENLPVPFFMVDPDLVVTYMNERLERLTGYSSKEVVGRMTCAQVLNTEQCGTCDCVLRQVMEQGNPLPELHRVVRHRNGQEIPVTVSAFSITDPSGKVIGGFEALGDITPIIEAEEKINLLAEYSREGLLMADENQRVVYLNTPMAAILQQPKEEVLGKHLGEILPPRHVRMALELANRVERDQESETRRFCSMLDLPHQSQDPRVFETCMAVSRLRTKVLTFLYLRDLTDWVGIERELKKTYVFLHNIIQNSVDGIVVVDPKGVPVIFNEGAERILGYKADEIIGNPENFHRFYPRQMAKEMMRRMRSDECGPPDKLNTTRVTFINKAGEEVPVNFSATIIRERGQEVGSVGIFSDLREILKVYQELEATHHQLVQAEKIASLGRMAAGVAHEINNPLAGILIYAELLARELEPDSIVRENVDIIIEQTMRCQQIVHRLLDFSRQSPGQRQSLDINEKIRRCVDLVRNQAFFHNIEISLQLAPELPEIIGNSGQLQHVFTNLLLNAADAMSGTGTITIFSSPTLLHDGVVLRFVDTGVGIPPEIIDKIFEPFFTTKPPGKGTGLGLSIVYGIIQRHGGEIKAESAPGCGTTFTITLPRESPDSDWTWDLKSEQ